MYSPNLAISPSWLDAAKAFACFAARYLPRHPVTMFEMGCGHGTAALFMRPLADRLVLMDIDDASLGVVREVWKNDTSVSVVKRNMHAGYGPLSPSDGMASPRKQSGIQAFKQSSNLFYYFLSLHHIEDTAAELSLANSMLTDDGVLLICEMTPVAGVRFHRYDSVPHDGMEYAEVVNALEQSGFEIIVRENLPPVTRPGTEKPLFPLYAVAARKPLTRASR